MFLQVVCCSWRRWSREACAGAAAAANRAAVRAKATIFMAISCGVGGWSSGYACSQCSGRARYRGCWQVRVGAGDRGRPGNDAQPGTSGIRAAGAETARAKVAPGLCRMPRCPTPSAAHRARITRITWRCVRRPASVPSVFMTWWPGPAWPRCCSSSGRPTAGAGAGAGRRPRCWCRWRCSRCWWWRWTERPATWPDWPRPSATTRPG